MSPAAHAIRRLALRMEGQLGCWASLAAWVLDLCSPLLQSLEASGRTGADGGRRHAQGQCSGLQILGLWQLRSLPGAIICDATRQRKEQMLQSRLWSPPRRSARETSEGGFIMLLVRLLHSPLAKLITACWLYAA